MFYDVLCLKSILGFLLSKRTSGVSPVIFSFLKPTTWLEKREDCRITRQPTPEGLKEAGQALALVHWVSNHFNIPCPRTALLTFSWMGVRTEALKNVENSLKWSPGMVQGFRSSRQHNSQPPIPEPQILIAQSS